VHLGKGVGENLLSVEQTRDGRRCLVAYRWNDFGFTGLAQSEEIDSARILESESGPPLARIHRGSRNELCSISVKEDRLVLRAVARIADNAAVAVGRFRGGSARVAAIVGSGRSSAVRLVTLDSDSARKRRARRAPARARRKGG
jgi:predicted O-methyltransferase YrrM